MTGEIERVRDAFMAELSARSGTPIEELERLYEEGKRQPSNVLLGLLDYCVECGERFKESDDKAEVYETRVGGTGPYLVHADPCYMQNQAKYSLA